MQIKRVRSRRFLSFGEEWADIDFTKLGRIINIKGINEDYGEGHSNASGKTSCLEMVVYGLYGKLLKGLNHKTANHIHSKKGLEIEIWVDDMFIRRTRSPDTLTIEINGHPAEVGGITSTQEEINRRLKLNYDGFVNVAMFGQHSLHGFLESEAADKRRIAENLLGLDDYARFHEIAKKQRAFLTDSIKELSMKHEANSDLIRRISSRIMSLTAQQSQWLQGRNQEINDLNKRIISINDEIKDLSVGIDPEIASRELNRIDKLIKEKENKRKELLSALSDSEPKVEALRIEYESASVNLSKNQAQFNIIQQSHKKKKQDIELAETSKGKKCPRCLGIVREENINLMTEGLKREFAESSKTLESLQVQIEQNKARIEELSKRYDRVSLARTKARQEEASILSGISALIQERSNYTKLPVTVREAALVKEIEMLNQRLQGIYTEIKENDPFRTLILAAESEVNEAKVQLEEIRSEVNHKDKLLPYYEYWVRGFGDKGIRSFLFEERLPALNARINHWLRILSDNKLKMTFDRDLSETIRHVPDDNKKFVYNALSGGELKRIDLAINQAFAYVTAMSSSACPSIVFLDEVGSSLDKKGILSVFKMIEEMAREKQVVVITHDSELLEMLNNCDTITARMHNGVTSLEINHQV